MFDILKWIAIGCACTRMKCKNEIEKFYLTDMKF